MYLFYDLSNDSNVSNTIDNVSTISLLASSSDNSMTGSNGSHPVIFTQSQKNGSQILVEPTSSPVASSRCLWQDCTSDLEPSVNILEHIQNVHVAPQINMDGYICLWEGCKVFNKKSCSLSWLERHVLSHGGNKPFKCIIPGCGQSFSAQGTLERHVNSHISGNGGANGTTGPNGTLRNPKLDSSPSKASRRKKQRQKKQRQSIGQTVDYFDKHTMELIKHRLVASRNLYHFDEEECTFHAEVLNWRFCANEEPHVHVRWYPSRIYPDEWMPQSKYVKTKAVPLRRIPQDKIKILYPNLFPPERKEKAQRKWKGSGSSSSCSDTTSSSSWSLMSQASDSSESTPSP